MKGGLTWTSAAGCGLAVLAGAPSFAEDTGSSGMHPRVKIETTLGDIVLELDAEKAPISTLNFIQYAQDKYYDGTIFHRVIAGFMIQGGGFTVDGKKTEGLREGIKNEWQNGLKNKHGTIAMARLGGRPDSATAQFFINVADNASLNQARDGAAYAVFGKVVEGMEIVEKIRAVEVARHATIPGGKVPVEPVVIKSVRVVSPFDRTKVQAAIQGTEEKVNTEVQERNKKYEEAQAKGIKTDSGLIIYDLKEGEGPVPEPTAKVEVHYTGWLTDGAKFDSSVDRGQPFTFSLTGGVIQGWLEGVKTMKVGGKRILIIPSDLGYGSRGSPPKIGANATLVFEVELLSIK